MVQCKAYPRYCNPSRLESTKEFGGYLARRSLKSRVGWVSTQPWLIEIGNMHGRGAQACFPDGSIRSMDQLVGGM